MRASDGEKHSRHTQHAHVSRLLIHPECMVFVGDVVGTPPPYECSFTDDPQRRNDWRCLLENEVNDTRQEGASFQ
ncbi:unnamed protein product [Toxocara canis]|uniref:Metallophos domain-containing protein n=1 Tax=Toxocara canis TaxID=6265 RepID=A0A183UFA6_TOXCA|nr:unnamed protein product [Toxocara canis]